MKRVILDASVATKLFLTVPGSDLAWRAAKQFHFVAPALVLTETANALWKYVKRGDTTAEDATGAVTHLAEITEIHDNPMLVERALSLACKLSHPVYDCTYLALAEAEKLALLSADKRLLALAQEHIWPDVIPLNSLTSDKTS